MKRLIEYVGPLNVYTLTQTTLEADDTINHVMSGLEAPTVALSLELFIM